MKEQLINELISFLISIIGLVSTYVLVLAGNYINEKKKQIALKGKSDQFNYALSIAKGLYVLFEKEFEGIEKAGEQKKDALVQKLLQVIPELSKEETDSIIEKVWSEFNTNIIKEVTSPINKAIEE